MCKKCANLKTTTLLNIDIQFVKVFIVYIWKACDVQASGGSNPPLSAPLNTAKPSIPTNFQGFLTCSAGCSSICWEISFGRRNTKCEDSNDEWQHTEVHFGFNKDDNTTRPACGTRTRWACRRREHWLP